MGRTPAWMWAIALFVAACAAAGFWVIVGPGVAVASGAGGEAIASPNAGVGEENKSFTSGIAIMPPFITSREPNTQTLPKITKPKIAAMTV